MTTTLPPPGPRYRSHVSTSLTARGDLAQVVNGARIQLCDDSQDEVLTTLRRTPARLSVFGDRVYESGRPFRDSTRVGEQRQDGLGCGAALDTLCLCPAVPITTVTGHWTPCTSLLLSRVIVKGTSQQPETAVESQPRAATRAVSVADRSAGLKRTWSAGAACPCRSASRTDLSTSMVWRSISGLPVAKATRRRLRVLLRVSRQPPRRAGRALLSVRSSREDRRCHRAPRVRRPHRSPPAGSGRPGRRV